MKVDIEKGSGYFHIIESRPGIVDLKYAEKKKQIQVGLKKKTLKVTEYTSWGSKTAILIFAALPPLQEEQSL